MYLCILLLPFLSFLSCVGFGRYLGTSGACFLSPTAIFLAFFLSILTFFETAVMGSTCTLFIGK